MKDIMAGRLQPELHYEEGSDVWVIMCRNNTPSDRSSYSFTEYPSLVDALRGADEIVRENTVPWDHGVDFFLPLVVLPTAVNKIISVLGDGA